VKTPDPGPPRLRDAAALLPVLGTFLLMPPVISLFTGQRALAGVPLIVVYLFGVWLLLIVAAALMARRLARSGAAGPDAASAAAGPASVPEPTPGEEKRAQRPAR